MTTLLPGAADWLGKDTCTAAGVLTAVASSTMVHPANPMIECRTWIPPIRPRYPRDRLPGRRSLSSDSTTSAIIKAATEIRENNAPPL